jgi:phosphatidate cytidylyltransferase
MKKPLIIRVISALIALGLLISSYYFFELKGLKFVVYFAVVVGGYELIQILLPKGLGNLHKLLFYIFLLPIFHIAANYPSFAVVGFTLLTVLFLVLSVLTNGAFAELETLLNYQAKSVLGFIYIGLLPSYAYRLLELPNGFIWFLTLLGIVFAGDIGAYAAGVLVGRHKIMPRLSPKKTWEGALGGLLGSLALGYTSSYFLPHVSPTSLMLTAVCAGFVAQVGDFFESLVKRVADVKDSGKLMPGHGGVLDRLDGVLFASPIIMIVASLFESL